MAKRKDRKIELLDISTCQAFVGRKDVMGWEMERKRIIRRKKIVLEGELKNSPKK